jgi:EmrB/QacA subfamily drug resistance transporter
MRYAWAVLGVICFGAFMGALNQSAVNVAFPILAETFDVSTAVIGWVTVAQLIAAVSTTTIFGRLSDIVGRRGVYIGGFWVFLLGSLLSGLAPNLSLLIAARVITGIGQAMSIANSVALVGAVFPHNRRGTAVSMVETSVSGALAIAPVAGGYLVELFGWRSVFLFSVPLALVVGLTAQRVLRASPRPSSREAFDFIGAAIFTLGMVTLLLGLTSGTRLGWTSPMVVGGLLGGLGLLVVFVLVERRIESPMIAMSLFANPVFTAANAAKVMCYLAMMSATFLAPFYYLRSLGMAPSEVGLAMLPLAVALTTASLIMGPLSDRIGDRVIRPAGMALAAIGAVILTRAEPEAGLPLVVVGFIVLMFGAGSFISPNDATIIGAAPRDRLGVAGGILAMTRSLGMILGIALAGTAIAAREPIHLAAGASDGLAFAEAFREYMWVVAALCALGTAAAMVGDQRTADKSPPH